MKRGMVLLSALFIFAAFFFCGQPALADTDEVAELKKENELLKAQLELLTNKVEAMSGKIDELQQRQADQTVEVEKIPVISEQVSNLKESMSESPQKGAMGIMENTHVGGHLKLYLYDQSIGERNDDKQHNNISAGVSTFYFYISKQISDWLGVDVETQTSVSASATPSLGSNITRATSGSVSTSLYKAYVTARLPHEYQLRAGLMKPLFSEDYANETWWDQLYHTQKGLDYLQSWQDTGVELYKNFDFEQVSLPVSLYALNGNTNSSGQFVDNNNDKSLLAHVAPEFFNGQLRLPTSYGYGKWDDDDDKNLLRWTSGADWKYKKLNLMGEYLYAKWDDRTLTGTTKTADAKREGYQVKLLYRFFPKWRGLVNFSHVELYNSSAATMRSDIYDTLTFGLNYFLTDSSTIIGQYSIVDADRSDESEALNYSRFTLSLRTTF